MTGIKPEIVIGAPKAQTNLPKITIGAKITAEIARSSQSGLEIKLGQTKYLLELPTDIPKANKLTFSATKQLNDGQYKVQVLGLNDRPLKNAIQGQLTPKPAAATAHDSPVTITKDHRFNIVVRLATIDGRTHSPSFVVETSIPSEGGPSKKFQPPPASASALPQQSASSSIEKLTPEAKASQSANPPRAALGYQNAGKSIEATSFRHRVVAEQSLSPPPRQNSPFAVTQQSMMATVIGGRTNDAKILLKVDTGQILKVEQSIDLPIGATLKLTMASGELPFVNSHTIDAQDPISRLIKLLEEIEKSNTGTITSQQSNAAHQLPKPDRHLVSQLLQLINLQQASATDEFGAVHHHRDDATLPKQDFLRSFLSDIGHAMTDSLTEGWRGTALPLGSDPTQAIMIYFREHMPDPETDNSGDEEQQRPVQRAVFDINFKHLGRCQIDALCQEQRFDLQVRSERQFSSEDQQVITDLFASACEIAGFKGEIGYKQGQFIQPAQKSLPSTTFTT